ncbi:beta-N-acetylhexosaminidase [Brachybacterium endophyticum]|uniref:beta-N-acetylhexosaminidase n=1 Tax=Brachybacterium endophyticum TaxID=2182385 RepID=A0A2U2RKY1_9MICO|nr:beta-N-acetylhexosaminidase [Brachybacterium endophyticum]PWH06496.1 beta-N-acetylhexosaminidase [Brachybacterium endophyticum]
MSDPISLVPLPRSVIWSSGTWETTDPWEGLSVGISEDLPRTEYALSITPSGAHLSAGSEAALADGRNTFNQIVLTADGSIPCVTISDSPEHAWRGVHLDVARHFFDVETLHRFIDALALHRLNVLHLHLTDDQGWRVEIKGYPKLTEFGSRRERTLVGHMSGEPESWEFDDTPHEGFYTQDELRELVTYAQNRGVMIVPEIDLPGHMQAAIASYPELGNFPNQQIEVRQVWGISDHVLGVSDQAFDFVRDVLEQVAGIFPAPFFHIGGDECPRTEWERSSDARNKMNEWGLTRVSEIQGRFTRFASDVLAEQGKTVVAWDEVLESHVPDDVVVMNWRTDDGLKESLDRGFRTVVSTSSHLYFDYYQGNPKKEPLAIGGDLSLKDVYTDQLLPKKLDEGTSALVLGVQGQVWTEYIATPEQLGYMAFPRVCALAERAWGSPEQSFSQFEERLRGHLPRLDALGVSYRPLD